VLAEKRFGAREMKNRGARTQTAEGKKPHMILGTPDIIITYVLLSHRLRYSFSIRHSILSLIVFGSGLKLAEEAKQAVDE
jgi:hypothetical protein